MLKIKFRSLIAWSPIFSQVGPVARDPEFVIQSEDKYVPQRITSQQGRRLSELTKTSVDLALRLAENEPVDYVIFSSRHGELANAAQLLKMIGENEILSPTLFSQSVHNTSVGMFSLFKKDRAPATSVSAGKNGFMMGLVSAYGYLHENPEGQVLYISSDEAVPERLAIGLHEDNVPFGTALLLKNSTSPSSGRDIQFSRGPVTSVARHPSKPQTIEFFNWFFSSSPQGILHGDSAQWTVQKC